MGCNGSKAAKKVEEPTKAGDAEPAKTLLATEPAKATEAECTSCGNKGKDTLGKRCACSYGQALKGPLALLKITIVSARSLRNADCAIAGKSDPYCVVEIADQPEAKIETPVVGDQLNPEWNLESEVKGYCIGNSITFTVKDKDPVKPDDFLGKVTLTTAQFFTDGFDGEVQLTDAGTGVEAFLKVKVAVVHPKVRVTVVAARGLRNADWVGKSDPYCLCGILGKADTKFQTPTVDDNLNPEWNHESLVVDYHIEDSLIFTVKDKDPLKPDDILGKVSLPYESFLETGFEGELQLTDTANGLESFLKIKVELGEKIEPVDDVAPVPVMETADEQLAIDEKKEVEDLPRPVVPEDITEETVPSQGKSCWC